MGFHAKFQRVVALFPRKYHRFLYDPSFLCRRLDAPRIDTRCKESERKKEEEDRIPTEKRTTTSSPWKERRAGPRNGRGLLVAG